MKKAVVLWTGGKDSALAFQASIGKYSIERLITFVPEAEAKFMAHSLQVIEAQAKSIGIKHECMVVKQPYDISYINCITKIKQSGIDTLITGDISTIDDYPNWIRECAQGIMEVHTPLWKLDRKTLIKTIIPNNYKIICSLSYKKYSSNSITGCVFDTTLIDKLIQMESDGEIDAAGENGEYHTMVLSAPFFKYEIQVDKSNIIERKEFTYLSIEQTSLVKNKYYQ